MLWTLLVIGLAGVVVLALASTGAGRALLGGKKVREHRCPSCGADVASVGFLSWNGLGDSLNVLRTGSASPTDSFIAELREVSRRAGDLRLVGSIELYRCTVCDKRLIEENRSGVLTICPRARWLRLVRET
ncbi:MAG: hypothetical protein IT378_14390 [Sandaracinaceae bacterium]|nr:hypothetical protein [Sandaracinaceae bacterium]